MKNYKWILFDADETLFHFDDYSGLELMFTHYGAKFSVQDYKEYQTTNKPLWVDYQNGDITAQQLQLKRFDMWTDKLQAAAFDLNSTFLTVMAGVSPPLEGAISLLNFLKGKVKLGIITNGFTQLQQARLEYTGLADHFDLLVVSEEVGVAKPHKAIFEHAFSAMGNQAREHVLMVGDNPDSDILGALNAGFDTCWLNINKIPAPEGIKPHYQVSSLMELENLLLQSFTHFNNEVAENNQ